MKKIINSIYVSIIWFTIWIIASLGGSLFIFLIDQLRFTDEDLLQIILREVLIPGGASYLGLKLGKNAYNESYTLLSFLFCLTLIYSIWHFDIQDYVSPARDTLILWSIISSVIGLSICFLKTHNLEKENPGKGDIDYLNS